MLLDGSSARSIPANDVKVLIVDDHPVFRRGLRQAIEEQKPHWHVAEACNGQEALRHCDAQKVHIAVLDYEMETKSGGKKSGVDVARHLRRAHPAIRVVILTMHKDPALFRDATRAGVGVYVLKDEPITEVIRAIQVAIDGGKFLSEGVNEIIKNEARDDSGFAKISVLTTKERELLRLIAEDYTSKEIAQALDCSVHTVNTHRQSMSIKLGLRGSHSLLRFAYAHREEL